LELSETDQIEAVSENPLHRACEIEIDQEVIGVIKASLPKEEKMTQI